MDTPGTASATSGGSGSDDLLHQIKEAMKDDNVIAHLAERIGAIVTEKSTARLNRQEKALSNTETKIKQLEQKVTQLVAQVDNLEQRSRRTSIGIIGMEENKNNGEDLEKIITNLIGYMNLQGHITLDNINRQHRIGPRNSLTNKNHTRQIIIQDYKSKTTFIIGRKSLRRKYPDVYITEDLTKTRSRQ